MIYLLHSTVPLKRANGRLVQHYLGWCREGHLADRLLEHRSGHSKAKIVEAFRQKGASLLLTATWLDASKNDERRLKRLGHLNRFCLVCSPNALAGVRRTMPRRYRRRAS